MSFKAVANHAPVIFPVHFTAGEAADKQVFVADRAYEVLEVIEVHRIVGAGSSTIMIEKTASGVAPGSGVDILATAFALDSTVDIPISKNVANGGLVTAQASRILERGDSLTVDAGGTVTDYEGTLTFVLKPLRVTTTAY